MTYLIRSYIVYLTDLCVILNRSIKVIIEDFEKGCISLDIHFSKAGKVVLR